MDDLARIDPQAVVGAAIERYLASRHERVAAFVDANFSLRGTLRLHRHVLGPDLLRAPANVALVVPFLLCQLAGRLLATFGLARAGAWLQGRRLFLETDLGRELAWRLRVDLLELPCRDRDRGSEHDALAATIAADPGLSPLAVAWRRQGVGEDEARLAVMLEAYAGARHAAADLVNNALLAGTSALLFKQLTPGALTFGPVIAAAIAQQVAVLSFPLGAGLGGLWYGWFPAEPSLLLTAAATVALMLLMAFTAGFAGLLGDPLQRALGLHQRRLHRLIDAVGRELGGDSAAAFAVRDHYVARIFDLIEVVRATIRGP